MVENAFGILANSGSGTGLKISFPLCSHAAFPMLPIQYTLSVHREPAQLTLFPFNSHSIQALFRSGGIFEHIKIPPALPDHATPFPLPADRKRPIDAPCRVIDAPFPFIANFPKFPGWELIGVQ